MDQQINSRIKQIMEYVQMSPANFSTIIGVNRSNLAHIFSGRNQPSFAMLEKILKAFPTIRSEWLITGIGQMIKSEAELLEAQELQKKMISENSTTPPFKQTELSFDDFDDVDASQQMETNTLTTSDDLSVDTESENDDVPYLQEPVESRDLSQSPASMTPNAEDRSGATLEPVLSKYTPKSGRNSTRNSKFGTDTRRISHETRSDDRKKVKKIVFFYYDNSFEEFYPEL